MAVVGILSGIGLSNILEMLKSRYSKDKLIFVYRMLICLFIIFSIASITLLRSHQKLINLNLDAMKKRGDYELNVLLYNFLNINDEIKDVYVIRDYNNLNLLPEINHEFLSIDCKDFENIQKTKLEESYYILIDLKEINLNKNKEICNSSVTNFINDQKKKNNIMKIFEYKNYLMYLRKT